MTSTTTTTITKPKEKVGKIEALVSKSAATRIWFPAGVSDTRINRAAYTKADDPKLRDWIRPLLPSDATDVGVVVLGIPLSQQHLLTTLPLPDVKDRDMMFEMWTNDPLGWYIQTLKPDYTGEQPVSSRYRVSVAGPAHCRPSRPWLNTQGTVLVYHRKSPLFTATGLDDGRPAVPWATCLLVAYKSTALRSSMFAREAKAAAAPKAKAKAKPKKAAAATAAAETSTAKPKKASTSSATGDTVVTAPSKAEVQKLLQEVLDQAGVESSHKVLAQRATKYVPRECTLFDFLNAYHFDWAANAQHPTMASAHKATTTKKSKADATTDPAEEVAEGEHKRKRTPPVVPKACMSRILFSSKRGRRIADGLTAADMLRFTDVPIKTTELLEASRSTDGGQFWISDPYDLFETLLNRFVRNNGSRVPFVAARCSDPANTIPADPFRQRLTQNEEIVRLADRFIMRVDAVSTALDNKEAVNFRVSVPAYVTDAGKLLGERYRRLEYVTMVELAAVLGMRESARWRNMMALFYERALKPMLEFHFPDTRIDLDKVRTFFQQTLQLFGKRIYTPQPSQEPSGNGHSRGRRDAADEEDDEDDEDLGRVAQRPAETKKRKSTETTDASTQAPKKTKTVSIADPPEAPMVAATTTTVPVAKSKPALKHKPGDTDTKKKKKKPVPQKRHAKKKDEEDDDDDDDDDSESYHGSDDDDDDEDEEEEEEHDETLDDEAKAINQQLQQRRDEARAARQQAKQAEQSESDELEQRLRHYVAQWGNCQNWEDLPFMAILSAKLAPNASTTARADNFFYKNAEFHDFVSNQLVRKQKLEYMGRCSDDNTSDTPRVFVWPGEPGSFVLLPFNPLDPNDTGIRSAEPTTNVVLLFSTVPQSRLAAFYKHEMRLLKICPKLRMYADGADVATTTTTTTTTAATATTSVAVEEDGDDDAAAVETPPVTAVQPSHVVEMEQDGDDDDGMGLDHIAPMELVSD